MSCSVVWLKDDFRTSYNQAINALIEDENKEKKIIYIYEKRTYLLCEAQQWWLAKSLEIFQKKLYIFMKKKTIFCVKLSNGGLLNL